MGNTMSCFDRWGKRTPDGALFAPKKRGGEDDRANALFSEPKATLSTTASTATPAAPAAATPAAATGGTPAAKSGAPGERTSRRRQTYSSNANKAADTEMSSYGEEDDFDESEDEELTTSDVRQNKLMAYRRTLTKVVKLKTHLLNATVKVTCSRDGKEVEWYKGHSQEGGKAKPVGSLPVEKITNIKAQADNPKGLTISVNNPAPTTFSFTFKTKEEREAWQNQLESLRKFMAMI
ncbi:hypothetical protein, conserved [Eimeria maxima]|uniref:Uncharacterized protein n=1 Tax=Eimeria maxima TaxID=5804 RepID=U6MG92_EIMMA|nr:hypothetical protein, conserved [Eimeria maxima]CDJ60665.1 hypothetical protein, conserved [Eimeria maxima]